MKEELTTKMHNELTVTKEEEDKLRAGCVWHIWCDGNSSKEDIEKWSKHYSISYETAMRWKEFWLRRHRKA